MSDLPDSPLERAVDELYDGPSDDFVARRAALAAAFTRDGYRVEAAALKKLRRPTVAADAVNRVARNHPDDVHELAASGDRLRQAQEDAVAGRGAVDLRAAQKARNEIVERLTDLALAVLADSSPQPESYRSALASTFEAASIDPDARASVASGTLVKEIMTTSRGLSTSGMGEAVVARGSAGGTSTRRAGATAAARDSAAITEARRIEREAQRLADRDEAAAMRARALADEAARVVEGLEEAVAVARRSEREARAAARVADRVARDRARAAIKAADRARSLEHPDG